MKQKEFNQPSLEQVQEAFRKAKECPEIQNLLRTLYGDAVEQEQPDNRPVTERIKTFEDALNALGEEHLFVKAFRSIYTGTDSDIADVVAYHKLRIVCAALNEGWEPNFTEDEMRWYPWHWLYTQDEINRMQDAEKARRHLMPTSEYRTEYAGFGSADSYNAPSNSNADVGSRLCLFSEELADYCGKRFIDLWADFKLIRK